MTRWLHRHRRSVALAAAGIGATLAYAWQLYATDSGLDFVHIAFGIVFGTLVLLAARNDDMHRQLAANERRLHDIAAASGDWLWETGPDLRFTYLSDNFPKVTGQDPARVIGRSRADLRIGQEVPEVWRRHMDDVANRRPFRDYVYSVRRPGCERQVFKASGVPIFDDAGRFQGYRGVASDITTLTRAEREARSLEADLVRAQRLETLGVFAGGVAHDVNNALSPILTVTRSLIQRLGDRPRESQDLGLAYEAALRCRDLIAELLALVRRDGDTDTLIDLKGPIADAIGMVRRSIPGHICFAAAIDAVPMPVVSAPVKVIQIVANLVTNAIQAIGDDAGEIRLRVKPAANQKGFLIEVRDTGPGMDPAMHSRIFEPFFTTKPPHIGSGLGLSAVHSLARGLGGGVTVDSQPGQGACFVVSLPRAAAAVMDASMAGAGA